MEYFLPMVNHRSFDEHYPRLIQEIRHVFAGEAISENVTRNNVGRDVVRGIDFLDLDMSVDVEFVAAISEVYVDRMNDLNCGFFDHPDPPLIA